MKEPCVLVEVSTIGDISPTSNVRSYTTSRMYDPGCVRPPHCVYVCLDTTHTHNRTEPDGQETDTTQTQHRHTGRKEGRRETVVDNTTTHTDLSTLHYTTLCPYILRHRSRLHDTLLILRVHCTLSTRSCLGSEGRGQEDTITHFSNFQTTTPYQACLQAHI